jgi:hypothetical protein
LKHFEEDAKELEQAEAFVKDLTSALLLTYQLNIIPDDDVPFQIQITSYLHCQAFFEDRIVATLELMDFLKERKRNNAYIKYIHVIEQQHIAASNYTGTNNIIIQ